MKIYNLEFLLLNIFRLCCIPKIMADCCNLIDGVHKKCLVRNYQ